MNTLPPAAPDADIDTLSPDEPVRTRRCLKCRREFPSAWAGERVCGGCKGRADWRKGGPMPTHSAGRRR